MGSHSFSPERHAAARAYLQALVDRLEGTQTGKNRGITRASELLGVSQPTITNALGTDGTVGPKLLEALAKLEGGSFA